MRRRLSLSRPFTAAWRIFLLSLALVGLSAAHVSPAMGQAVPKESGTVFSGDPIPVQLSGSAAGLPHLVDTDVTRARISGPSAELKQPKGGLPLDPETRGLPAAIPQEQKAGRLPQFLAPQVLQAAAAECVLSAWSSWATYQFGDIVSYNGRDWRAVNPTRSVAPSSPAWTDLGPCATGQTSPPIIIEMLPTAGAQVGTLTPKLSVLAESRVGTDEWGALRYSFQVETDLSAYEPDQIDDEPFVTVDSGWLAHGVSIWRVPAGKLEWGKPYRWRVTVQDTSNGSTSTSDFVPFVTGVRQPPVSSQIAVRGANGQEFDQLSGNYTTRFVDASIASAGPPLAVVRSYNSADPRTDGMFGPGWSTKYDMKVVPETINGEPAVRVTYPDGRQVRFGNIGGGRFQAPPGMYATVAEVDGGGWRLMDKTATSYHFDASGRLTRIEDNRGRTQEFAYNTDGKLATVTAVGGRSLSFTWNGNRVSSVSTNPVNGAPLTWTYHYTSDRLTGVCAPVPAPNCTTFEYGTGSRYSNLVRDADPMGYWRLDDPVIPDGWQPPSGCVGQACQPPRQRQLTDLGWGFGPITVNSPTFNRPGALAGTTNTAAYVNFSLPRTTMSRLGTQYSFETWFKTSEPGIIFSIPTDTLFSDLPALYVGQDGRLRAQFNHRTNNARTPTTTSSSVRNNQWHHVVVTINGAVQTLYLNGQQVGTINNLSTTPLQGAPRIGGSFIDGSWPSTPSDSPNTSVSFPFGGTLDELAIYDRPLSSAEVAAHYQAGTVAAPHKLTKITLPSGRVWASNTYDSATDRLETHTDEHGGVWRIGKLKVWRDPDLADEFQDYSKRIVEVEDPVQSQVQSEAAKLKLTYIYDAWRNHRLIRQTDQLGKQTSYRYDSGGYLARVTDANGSTLAIGNDRRGNQKSRRVCRAPGNCQTEYFTHHLNEDDQFDPRNDRLIEFRDARSSSRTDNTYRTRWTYNTFGEPTSKVTPPTDDFPDGREIAYSYTDGNDAAAGGGNAPAGLIKSVTDARGNSTSHVYTTAGDLATMTSTTGLEIRMEYDAIGRLTSRSVVSDAVPSGATTTYAYDGLSRVIKRTEPQVDNVVSGQSHQAETTTTYDPDGNSSPPPSQTCREETRHASRRSPTTPRATSRPSPTPRAGSRASPMTRPED